MFVLTIIKKGSTILPSVLYRHHIALILYFHQDYFNYIYFNTQQDILVDMLLTLLPLASILVCLGQFVLVKLSLYFLRNYFTFKVINIISCFK